MFSSALKSFTSNISANYTIAAQPSSTSGPWKIFDAKKKSTGKPASVFVFDKKSLDAPGAASLGGRSGASSLKRAHEEVLERLKKEASSLARLRHPSILELVEPVEETRNGGLQFATEPVTASLAGLLAEKDEQERSGGIGGRGSRYVVEETDGKGRRRRELEIDELEIQKGLLQIGKGLEFMHDNAGLVHANLTPDAIFVNAKSDWKISGLGFSGPASDSSVASSLAPISLSETLNHDPRLPRSVQLNIDYTSPDFVHDNNLTSSADMFSLGLLIIALYNSPHQSPLDVGGSLSAYRRIFSSSSAVPTQNNNFLSKGPLPKDLISEVLPRLITRRPAQRLTAKAFQQAQYFDNILVSTIRFLDELPAKTANEKAQFMRGLPRIMPQFPASVLTKKVLPALLEEMKDRELLASILQNIFAIVKAMPSGKRTFTETVIPRLREIFLSGAPVKSGVPDKDVTRDATKEAGLMVVMENMPVVAQNASGKEFRDDILPIIALGLSSPTHTLVDASLSTLPFIVPVLDYSTIKNELFPVITNVFSHTNSLGIKIKGLEAFHTLCGGSDELDGPVGDGLDGTVTRHADVKASAVLDKFTIQEKVVPLLKGIKTKEPGVMMAALKVFKMVGQVADTDFLAMDVLPILWSFSLGPLLDLSQFQAYMSLIKSLSSRIEREQTRKLQDLSSGNATSTTRALRGQAISNGSTDASGTGEVDFESLVSGRKTTGTPDIINDWDAPASRSATGSSRSASQQYQPQAQAAAVAAPTFSWSSQPSKPQTQALRPPAASNRAITPDLNSFAALTPSSAFSQPLQPSTMNSPAVTAGLNTNMNANMGQATRSPPAVAPTINWSAATNSNGYGNGTGSGNVNGSGNAGWAGAATRQPPSTSSSFSIAPPPMSQSVQTGGATTAAARVPSSTGSRVNSYGLPARRGGVNVSPAASAQQQRQQGAKTAKEQVDKRMGGLDRYESLL